MTFLYSYSKVTKNEAVPWPVMLCLCCAVDMERRDLSHKEKLYLREQNVITETQCTLGKNHTTDTLRPVKLFRYREQNPNILSTLCHYSLVYYVNNIWLCKSSTCLTQSEYAVCLLCVSRSDSSAEWRGDRSDDKGVSHQTLWVFSYTARERATENS